MKAEEFVKTFTKEEILDALFCKKCLNEIATRDLCVALFEEKSDRLLKKNETKYIQTKTEKFTRIYAATGKL